MALDEDRRRALGGRLRELRGAMPQRKIADRIGVTERTYGSWERGESGIQWEHLEDVAGFFKVSTNYLLYGSETRPENLQNQLDRIEQAVNELRDLLTTPAGAARVAAAAAGQAVETAESPPPPAHEQPPTRPAAARRKTA